MSKAFEKSRNIPLSVSPLSRLEINLSIMIIRAIYEECSLLNPNWPLKSNLWFSKNSSSRSYTTFQKPLTVHTIRKRDDNYWNCKDHQFYIMVEHLLAWVAVGNTLSKWQITKVGKRLIDGYRDKLNIWSSYVIMTCSAIFETLHNLIYFIGSYFSKKIDCTIGFFK